MGDFSAGSRVARAGRWLLTAAALAALVAAMPLLPSAWARLTAPGANIDGAQSGDVTVSRCLPGLFPGIWHCDGAFSYSDPMAAGNWHTYRGVVLADDPHYYRPGTAVLVCLRPGTRRAYDWGVRYLAGAVLLGIGAAVCALAAWLPFARRRAVPAAVVAVVLGLGVACVAPALAGQLAPGGSFFLIPDKLIPGSAADTPAGPWPGAPPAATAAPPTAAR